MEFMEICPSAQPQPFCALCDISVDWRFWPHHVDSSDHQIRARAHCPHWDENKRCCVVVIYCNCAAEPIPIIGYARRECSIEINDIILIPAQPEAAILEFFSVMDAFMFLKHSRESEVRYKRDCFVTHAIAANNFSQIGWMNLFDYNYHEPFSNEAVMNNSLNMDWPFSEPVPNNNMNIFDKLLEKAHRRNWDVKEARQYRRDNRPGQPALYFYEIEINGKRYQSPDAGTTKPEGLVKLGAFCMKSLFDRGKNSKKKNAFPVLNPARNAARARETRDVKSKGSQSNNATASPQRSKVTSTSNMDTKTTSNKKECLGADEAKISDNNNTLHPSSTPSTVKKLTHNKALPIEQKEISTKIASKAGNHEQKNNKAAESKHNGKAIPEKVSPILDSKKINNKSGSRHLKSRPSTQSTAPSSSRTKSSTDSVKVSKNEKITTSTKTPSPPPSSSAAIGKQPTTSNIQRKEKTKSTLKNNQTEEQKVSKITTRKSTDQIAKLPSTTSSSSSLPPLSAVTVNQITTSNTPRKDKPKSTLKNNHDPKVPKPIRRKSTEQTSVENSPPKQSKISLCKIGHEIPCSEPVAASSSHDKNINPKAPAQNEFHQPTEIHCETDDEITIVEEIQIIFDVEKDKDKVKKEKFSSPWPKVYLPRDYLESLKNPVEVLEKVCLVCGWGKPCYQMQVTVSDCPNKNNNDRLTYKLILNGIEFKSKQDESSEQNAKKQVAMQCLIKLAHHGAVPHPSVFINLDLDPVKRLENLIISRGLAKRQNEPLYTTIEDLTDGGFYCEVVLNGVSYDPIDDGCRPCETEVEAKKIAVEYCLQKLSSSISLYADESFTEKAKQALVTMSTEIASIKDANLSPAIFEKAEDLKPQCRKIKRLMRIPQNYLDGATAILRKLKHLFPHLQTKIFRNWYLRLYNYTAEDELFIYIFDTAKTDATPLRLNSIKKHILEDVAVKEKFPAFSVANSDNSNVSSSSEYIRSFVQNSNISSSNLPPFTLVTDPNCLNEVHLARLTHYFSTFDPRTVPLLAVIHYWAKLNKISFRGTESTKTEAWYDPAILDWLVINFLGGIGIIPTTRHLMEKPKPFSFNVHKMWSHLDTPYAKEWRSRVDSYKRNSAEFWLSVLFLSKNFFTFYADRFDEGSWIINTYDAEMIYCRDLLYGSFHTNLSPQWLHELVNEVRKRGTFKAEPRHKFYMILPKTDVNWIKMVTERVDVGSARIFEQFRVTASRLDHFLKNSDFDMDLCLLLKCYSISAK